MAPLSTDLSQLIGAALAKGRLGVGVRKARPLLLWPQAVGPEMARLTRARTCQGGTLVIEVRDSAAAHHFTMQRHHFLTRLNALLGEGQGVEELRFVVGRLAPPPGAPRAAPLPPAERARARKLAARVENADLGELALRAAEAVARARRWREEQGWRPCPVCGEPMPAPSEPLPSGPLPPGARPPASRSPESKPSSSQPERPPVPCRDCTLTLEQPEVRRLARRLVRHPEELPGLTERVGESGRLGARYLALAQLTEQLELLALECVRSGDAGYAAFLKAQAEVYLSLRLEKPRTALRRPHRAELPEAVRAVLDAEG